MRGKREIDATECEAAPESMDTLMRWFHIAVLIGAGVVSCITAAGYLWLVCTGGGCR